MIDQFLRLTSYDTYCRTGLSGLISSIVKKKITLRSFVGHLYIAPLIFTPYLLSLNMISLPEMYARYAYACDRILVILFSLKWYKRRLIYPSIGLPQTQKDGNRDDSLDPTYRSFDVEREFASVVFLISRIASLPWKDRTAGAVIERGSFSATLTKSNVRSDEKESGLLPFSVSPFYPNSGG